MLSAKTKKTVGKLITYAVLVTGSLFCIVPLVWMGLNPLFPRCRNTQIFPL